MRKTRAALKSLINRRGKKGGGRKKVEEKRKRLFQRPFSLNMNIQKGENFSL